MKTLANWPYPRHIAHRGAGKLAPENTLAAFRLGASHGYRAFEFDVKLSADNIPILLHDDTLDRTTNACGQAGALTWSELARLDAGSWHSSGYAGEPLPTLETIARFTCANQYAVNIEIKPSPGCERDTGRLVAQMAKKLWKDQPIVPLLSSFSEAALAAAQETEPDLPRALLLDVLPPDWLDRLTRLDCVALDANHAALDENIIALAHEQGFRVLCYTVNTQHRAEQLVAWGIDSLITDAVDQIKPVQNFV